MIGKLLAFSVRERTLVALASLLLLIGGSFAFHYLNVEVYPDPSPPAIEVIAQNPGWSAEEMERQITIPLETQLNGMAGLDTIRSISLFGLTDIKCYFRFEYDYNAARQEVLNRLQSADLPAGVHPQLSPWSALGEIYRYQVIGPGYTPMQLKEIQDWVLVRQFKQVPGILDVVSFGGPTKEFHVELDPNKLVSYGLSVSDVMNALSKSNSNVGANYLESGEQSYNVRGIGLFRDTADIGNVMVAVRNGTPIYVRQLGQVSIGSAVRLGKVGRDDDPDIVKGIVYMRRGEQTLPTLRLVEAKAEEINSSGILPKGVRIEPYYDRTELIHITTGTVEHTLVAGMTLIGFIMLAFLGDFRAALVVTLSVPLSLLLTFIVMVVRGDSANLISMGAIDFGIIVDASVIMVENIHRRFAARQPGPLPSLSDTVISAGREIASPIFFSTAVIIVAFIPLFTMRGVEGKIFTPMAVTYGLALTAALFLALTYAPALASLLLRPEPHHDHTFLVRWLNRAYQPLLRRCISHPAQTVAIGALAFAATLAAVPFLGGEFMPTLEEGSLWIRASMPNNISFQYASQIADTVRASIRKYPEVETVVSQLGRPDDGTDPVSWFNCDLFVKLKPQDQWPKGLSKQDLVRQMDASLRQIPGVDYNFSQYIQDNVNEAMSGVKGQNSIKLFGDDLQQLQKTAEQIKDVMKTVPGVSDLGIYALLGQPNLLIRIDRQRAARYGVLPDDVNGTVQAAIGGQAVTQVLDGERRFDVVVRFLPQFRSTPEAIAAIPVKTSSGYVPLRELADISRQTGASFIYREANARYLPIKFSVRGRDLESTISAAARIRRSVPMPPGFRIEWAGEFQQMRDALARLRIVVPVTVLMIVFVLYLYFHNLRDTLVVLGSVPLAMIGGIGSLLLTGTNFSISAAVGFISLFGVSVLNGVVLIACIKGLRRQGHSLRESVLLGAQLRLRPVIMASLAAAIGLFPAAIATGMGSQTQQPLARVVVGGMITAPILTLLVLPALYLLVERERVPVAAQDSVSPAMPEPSAT